MTSKHSAVIVEPVRTAIGTFGGTLMDIPAVELGAAAVTTRLLHSLRRDGLKKGIVTMCIGGGQGIALALEMVASR
jgi:acetyl-CoA C-acetyltransferase